MPLRLDLLDSAIERMMELVAAEDRRRWLDQPRQLVRDVDPDALRGKLWDRRIRVPWLVSIPASTTEVSSPRRNAPGTSA